MVKQRLRPRDKDKSKENQPPNDHRILQENEIKQEATIKQERESDSDGEMDFEEDFDSDSGRNYHENVLDVDSSRIKREVKEENIDEKSDYVPSGEEVVRLSSQHDLYREESKGERSKKAMRNDGMAKKISKADISSKKKKEARKENHKWHKCEQCDYSTPIKIQLIRHMRSHTDERPFPCTHCEKRFKQKAHLERHKRTHANEFPFSCSNCSKGFSEEAEQSCHEKECKVKRHHCDICQAYSTIYKDKLERHMRALHTHADVRQFTCTHCEKRFKQKRALEIHMRTHASKYPFSCEKLKTEKL